MTDVVKTRLQVEARKGQTSYKGLADAFTKICKLYWSNYGDALIQDEDRSRRRLQGPLQGWTSAYRSKLSSIWVHPRGL